MSGEHFTLTISQSTSDNGDFAIHLKDRKRNLEHFLMHIRFPESVIVDDLLMDDIVALVARCIAKRLLGQNMFNEEPSSLEEEEEAKKVVAHALEKMKKD